MSSSDTELNVLCRTEFPLYCVASIDGNIAVVAGGGGFSKSGIKNKFVSYFISI